jgi:hypothetical protein
MNNLKSFISSKPVFFLLLPVYFVLHGFTESFAAVPAKDALLLAGLYLISSLVIFGLAWLAYRNITKAALFSFCIMAFHFFFGAMQDMLKRWSDSFFSRYSFLFLFFLSGFVFFVVWLWRTKKPMKRLCFYLNLVLLILLSVDAGWLLYKNFSTSNEKFMARQAPIAPACDTCTKPDIYFLLFDEYAASSAMKELWNYDNDDLDSFLLQKGFRIQPYSRSNYNFTPFSMASTLNMDYLHTIRNPKACTVKDYTEMATEIKNNKVCSFLESMGFTIVNLSIFDLDKNPAIVYESFLPLKTKLITSQTFLSRVQKDLMHLLLVGRFEIKWLSKDLIYSTYHNNEKLISATLNESVRSSDQPRFIYSHIEMPHPPFYFNKNGRQGNKSTLIAENTSLPIKSYLEYLPYTNGVIKKIVNSILDNTKKPVVIILMGDHGFRTKQPEPYHFRNQNAVYISSGNYKGFYDTISNVNEFRVLFNNLFHTSLPLLKDSTSFLVDN